MREVKIGGESFKIRPFTRQEVLAGKEYGLKYWGIDLTNENYDAACDYTLGLIFTDKELDHLSVKQIRQLFFEVIKENWGSEDEEKNSPGSGQNDQTQSE